MPSRSRFLGSKCLHPNRSRDPVRFKGGYSDCCYETQVRFMIFFIANTICYANTACDGLIKSICYWEAKRGRWDFRIAGRVTEACGFVIRHQPSFYMFPHPFPHRQPPWPLDPSSQSGFTTVDSRPCMLLTRSTLRAPNPRGSPLLLLACGGLGAPCEAAETQARLSQLMQKQEKSFW